MVYTTTATVTEEGYTTAGGNNPDRGCYVAVMLQLPNQEAMFTTILVDEVTAMSLHEGDTLQITIEKV